jgi:hypothetical protein
MYHIDAAVSVNHSKLRQSVGNGPEDPLVVLFGELLNDHANPVDHISSGDVKLKRKNARL